MSYVRVMIQLMSECENLKRCGEKLSGLSPNDRRYKTVMPNSRLIKLALKLVRTSVTLYRTSNRIAQLQSNRESWKSLRASYRFVAVVILVNVVAIITPTIDTFQESVDSVESLRRCTDDLRTDWFYSQVCRFVAPAPGHCRRR